MLNLAGVRFIFPRRRFNRPTDGRGKGWWHEEAVERRPHPWLLSLHRYNNPWPCYPRPCYSTCRVHQGWGGLGARPSNSFADTRVLVPRWTPVNHVTRPRTDYPISDFPAKFRRFELRRTESIRLRDVQLLF